MTYLNLNHFTCYLHHFNQGGKGNTVIVLLFYHSIVDYYQRELMWTMLLHSKKMLKPTVASKMKKLIFTQFQRKFSKIQGHQKLEKDARKLE